MGAVRRSFTLDEERDAALLAWLDAQANTSEAIRAALRAAFDAQATGDGATLADVVRAIEGLGQRLAGLQIAPTGAATPQAGEDPELAAALDALGV